MGFIIWQRWSTKKNPGCAMIKYGIKTHNNQRFTTKMKVFSLYYKETFVVAFPNREDAIDYGKKYYDEYAWDCNILEEYLSKSPPLYSTPYIPPASTTTPTILYKDVRENWDWEDK